MAETFANVSVRALRAYDVFTRKPGREIHLHIGQVRLIADSPDPWDHGPEGLRLEAAAYRKLIDCCAQVAAELEARATDADKARAAEAAAAETANRETNHPSSTRRPRRAIEATHRGDTQ